MVLILTGTFKPQDNKLSNIINIDDRIRQYKNSLEFYIKQSKFKKIVLVDNSNYKVYMNDINKLAISYNKKFELIQFNGDYNNIVLKGKGYGEGEMIKYCIQNSKLFKDEDYFIKITGRLIVKNINKIYSSINQKMNYFNADDILGIISKRIDTRFYATRIEDYKKYLINSYQYVEDYNKYYIEHVFYDVIKDKKINHRSFIFYPIIKGISGSTGVVYRGNRSNKKSILALFNMYSIKDNCINKIKIKVITHIRKMINIFKN